MNELNRFLSSLLLLGGGFLAASFVGPPEAVDRLARYLRPTEPSPTDGLRPLDAGLAGANVQREWPALPTPQAKPAPPAVNSLPAETFVSQAVPASWPADTATTSAAPSGDWLTSETLSPTPPAAPTSRRLTPIPRSGSTQSMPAPPTESAGPAWPALNPPAPPAAPRESFTARKPTLEDSPYGTRPQQQAAPDDLGAFGFVPVTPRLERIERSAPAPASHGDHIVADGDTLALLAERYLGDASRANELFDLNRDRLDHPDVLPIGMILKTPERDRSHRNVSQAVAAQPGPGGFATLTASSTPAFATRPGSQRGDHRLTPIVPGAEPVRPAAPAEAPLYAQDAQWNTGGW